MEPEGREINGRAQIWDPERGWIILTEEEVEKRWPNSDELLSSRSEFTGGGPECSGGSGKDEE